MSKLSNFYHNHKEKICKLTATKLHFTTDHIQFVTAVVRTPITTTMIFTLIGITGHIACGSGL